MYHLYRALGKAAQLEAFWTIYGRAHHQDRAEMANEYGHCPVCARRLDAVMGGFVSVGEVAMVI